MSYPLTDDELDAVTRQGIPTAVVDHICKVDLKIDDPRARAAALALAAGHILRATAVYLDDGVLTLAARVLDYHATHQDI